MIKGDFKFLETGHPMIVFEDSAVGRLKKSVFDASEEEVDKILAEYEIPSDSELGKPGCYIQTTPRAAAVEKRRKNDI
ncbi:MAG: creatininase family protein, partial [Spirochaetales bacterium]|nr:creatininase family protein [Spirochaetales bacterium]